MVHPPPNAIAMSICGRWQSKVYSLTIFFFVSSLFRVQESSEAQSKAIYCLSCVSIVDSLANNREPNGQYGCFVVAVWALGSVSGVDGKEIRHNELFDLLDSSCNKFIKKNRRTFNAIMVDAENF